MNTMPPILYFFALCNLVIGSGAFVLGGILQPMSASLGISVAAAGQAMTAYAVATAVLAPLLIILTARWPRKRAVQLALALFTAGCLVCAIAPNLPVLLLGRVLMGAGAMFTAAAIMAVLVLWGIAGFGLMAPQQSRLASLSPAQAPLLLSPNGSMLYVGTALGSVISGTLLEQVGFAHLGWVGVPFGLLAMLTLVFDRMPARVQASAAA